MANQTAPSFSRLKTHIEATIATLRSTTITNDILSRIDTTNNTPASRLYYDLLTSLARSQDALSNLSIHLNLLQTVWPMLSTLNEATRQPAPKAPNEAASETTSTTEPNSPMTSILGSDRFEQTKNYIDVSDDPPDHLDALWQPKKKTPSRATVTYHNNSPLSKIQKPGFMRDLFKTEKPKANKAKVTIKTVDGSPKKKKRVDREIKQKVKKVKKTKIPAPSSFPAALMEFIHKAK